MAKQDDRIKIRELPDGELSSMDYLAVGNLNPEITIRATVGDVIASGLAAGDNITLNTASNITTINATGYDDSDLDARVTALENAADNQDNAASVYVQESPPPNAPIGSLWWDTNVASMYIHVNGVWVQTNTATASNSSTAVIISSTQPPQPEHGSLWYDTTVGKLFVYDDETGAWFQTNCGGETAI